MHEKLAFLGQKVNALVQFGTIDSTKAGEGKALARVKIGDRVTDFLPVKSIGNSVVKIWIPPLVGEQVVVISPFGDASSGFIIPSFFNIGCKEPSGANGSNAIIEVGNTRVEATKDGNIKVKAPVRVLLDTPLVETTGDLKVAGDISDSRGDLTGHKHATTDGAEAKPR